MPAPEVIRDPNVFDLTTHEFDTRGKIKAKNPYRLHIIDGAKFFERPVNSGNLWFENNQPAGRIELVEGVKKVLGTAPHKLYAAPATGAEKTHYENEDLKIKNAQLLAELEAIKAELEARVKVTAAQTTAAATHAPAPPSLKPQARKE